jgi:hypothetical protein
VRTSGVDSTAGMLAPLAPLFRDLERHAEWILDLEA